MKTHHSNKAAFYQQKQSETAVHLNASRTIVINGTNYTLSSTITGNDLCPHFLNLNCLQIQYQLTEIKKEIKQSVTQQLQFKIARALDDDGSGQSSFIYLQSLKACLDEKTLTNIVDQLAQNIFFGSGLSSQCSFTTQVINHIKMVVTTGNLDNKVCRALTNDLTGIFQTCHRSAEIKALEIGGGIIGGFLLLCIIGTLCICRSTRNNNAHNGYTEFNPSRRCCC